MSTSYVSSKCKSPTDAPETESAEFPLQEWCGTITPLMKPGGKAVALMLALALSSIPLSQQTGKIPQIFSTAIISIAFLEWLVDQD
jgi:hypothetical protein